MTEKDGVRMRKQYAYQEGGTRNGVGHFMHNIPQTWLPQKPALSAAGTGCRMLQRMHKLRL